MTLANWHDIGLDSFSASQSSAERGHYRSAVSRAYYAAYARWVGRMLDLGIRMPKRGNPTHTSLPELIANHENRLSLGRRVALAGALLRLYKLRLLADYQPAAEIDQRVWRTAMGLLIQTFRDCKEAENYDA